MALRSRAEVAKLKYKELVAYANEIGIKKVPRMQTKAPLLEQILASQAMKGFTLKLPANATPDHGVDGSEVTKDHGRQLKLSSYVDATFQRDYENPGIKSLRAATRDERALHATLDNLSRFGPSLEAKAGLSIVDHMGDTFPLIAGRVDTFSQKEWDTAYTSQHTSIVRVRFMFYRFISIDALVFLEDQRGKVPTATWDLSTIRAAFFDRREWSPMCSLDEATGKAYLEDDSMGNADILGDVMYTGSTCGRDQLGETFGVAVRVDFNHFNAEQDGDRMAGPPLSRDYHEFDARVIVRIPIALVTGHRHDEATLHWLEGICTGLSHSYRHDARTQARQSVQQQRQLCPRLTQARRPADVSVALRYSGLNYQLPQTGALHSTTYLKSSYAEFVREGKTIAISSSRPAGLTIFNVNGRETIRVLLSADRETAFSAKKVTSVKVKSTVHPSFHRDNFANLTATEAQNPLYENAGSLVLWVSPIVAPVAVAPPGFVNTSFRGSISRTGIMSGTLASHRAVVALSFMETFAMDRGIYAGKMRVPMAGTANSHEEKEWDRELRLWRAANTTTTTHGADTAGSAIVQSSTPVKTTNVLEKMWAEYVKTRDAPTMLPRTPAGVSTEADWDAFTTRMNDAKETAENLDRELARLRHRPRAYLQLW